MSQTPIRYFGADTVYGPDCQPLSPTQVIIVTEEGSMPVPLTVDQLTSTQDFLLPPVSYIPR